MSESAWITGKLPIHRASVLGRLALGAVVIVAGMPGATVVISVTTASTAQAATQPPSTISTQDWLGEVNYYRTGSRLQPVVDQPAWEQGIQDHLAYLARTPRQLFTGAYQSMHTENPESPYYTPDGAKEGASSNLAELFAGSTPTDYIDEWLSGPFHAAGMLRPGLQSVAFASAEGYGGLDVLSGLNYQPPSLVLFPGPGTITDLPVFAGGEHPDPTRTCSSIPGLGEPGANAVGLPLVMLLPAAPSSLLTAQMTTPSGDTETSSSGALCIVDSNTYVSSDAVYGPTGAEILRATTLCSSSHGILLSQGPTR